MITRWTTGAVGNLDQVANYIVQDNPPAAAAAVLKIVEAVRVLADYPAIGRRGRERGTRELVVAGLPYLIICVVRREELVIIRVLHAAMKYP